jgi:hypothetical protein
VDKVLVISASLGLRFLEKGELYRIVEAGEAHGHKWPNLNYVRFDHGERILFDDEILLESNLEAVVFDAEKELSDVA